MSGSRKKSVGNTFDNAQYIFNIMQNFPHYNLVVDVREPEEFEHSRLKRSVNVPYNSDFPGALDVNSIKAHMRGDPALFAQRRRCMIVIVYSPPGIAFAREVEFLLRRDKCKEVYILDEEFEVFSQTYPFLCVGANLPAFAAPAHGFPSEIVPGKLYLGDYHQAADPLVIRYLKISHIINATRSIGARFEGSGVVYFNMALDDSVTEDIAQYFVSAYNFIHSAFLQPEARVFVHCARGVSRSVTIVVMYLMVSRHLDYDAALEFVKKHREVANPNEGFEQQLRNWTFPHSNDGVRVSLD